MDVTFQVSGQRYRFNAAADALMGDELIEIEDRTGLTLAAWWARLESMNLSVKDICLLAYLARRREVPTLMWEPFVKTIAPLTFRWVDDLPAVESEPAENAEKAPAKPAARKRAPAKPVETAAPA